MDIYIENLSKEVTEDDLVEIFRKFGQADFALIVRSRVTGESIGLGLVAMPESAEAHQAISALNDREVKGRSIKVSRISSLP